MSNDAQPVYVAQATTTHFDFAAIGHSREEAVSVLMAAWRAHAEQYDADPGYLTAEDVNVFGGVPGQAFRDRSPFPVELRASPSAASDPRAGAGRQVIVTRTYFDDGPDEIGDGGDADTHACEPDGYDDAAGRSAVDIAVNVIMDLGCGDVSAWPQWQPDAWYSRTDDAGEGSPDGAMMVVTVAILDGFDFVEQEAVFAALKVRGVIGPPADSI